MSPLWKVTVIQKGKQWIDLEVMFYHPDAGCFPDDPAFAFLLLTSEAYMPISPLGEAIPYEHSYMPDTVRPRLSEFVQKVVVYEVHNVPFIEREAHAKMDDQVLADGIERGTPEWGDTWQKYWRIFWSNKDNLPWAIYRIWVTTHMEPGLSFSSTAYSEKGPWIGKNRIINLNLYDDQI
eukprot:gene16567-18842_t